MSTIITPNSFFKRQLGLIKTEGQEKLKNASVLVIGAGGLGCPALINLATSGIGNIGIIDADKVDLSNLHRQNLFSMKDVGEYKVDVAKSVLESKTKFSKITTYKDFLNSKNVAEIIGRYDIILECTDNFKTKFLVHDECFNQNKIFILSSVYQYEGQIQTFNFKTKGVNPCFRCLWENEPVDGCTGTCAEVGVLPPLVGVMGNLMAMEALKVVLDFNTLKNGESLFVDLITMDFEKRRWKKNENCPCCGKNSTFKIAEDHFQLDTLDQLKSFELVDLRSLDEISSCSYVKDTNYKITNIPSTEFDINKISKTQTYLFFCAKGVRSKNMAKKLRDIGLDNVYSFSGGVGQLFNELSKMERSS